MLSPGTRLGPYEIIAPLGAGGMGEVYRARDGRLSRDVALKILPPAFGHDPARKARFEQEARAAGALNHPNIVAVYDIGCENGIAYIVSELVEGESLRAIVERAALPVRKAIDVAVQIADALAAAHSAGIAHRDLKPENVMLARDNRAKLLDFGLARHLPQAAAASGSEAITLTQAGMVAGTAGYMSPEQVRGHPADHRSDIFSFGAVAYEMLAGRRAFEGGSAVETMHSVLNDDPPPFPAERRVPLALESIVRHCLEKGPNERFQSAWDLAFALEAVSGISTTAHLPAMPGPSRRFARMISFALACFAAGALVAWLALERFRDRHARHLALNNVTFAQLTDDAGPELHPSLSPDGKSFAYAARGAGNWNIYLRAIGSPGAVNLTRDSPLDDTQPAFSPDGRYIAFRSERDGGGIFVMTAQGDGVRRLSDAGYNPAWSPDGKQILVADEGIRRPEDRQVAVSRLWSIDVARGQKHLLSNGDAVQPQWSPHGDRIAYWAIDKSGQRDVWTMSAKGGAPVAVTRDEYVDWSPVWSPDGNFVYFSSNRGGGMNIWRVPIQESSGKVLRPPELVSTPSPYSGHLSFSRDGLSLAYVQEALSSSVQRVTFDPASETVIDEMNQVIGPSRQASRPALSPDGEWLAFNSTGPQEDIFVVRSNGTGLRQLTDDNHSDRGPRWSPDGRRIAFFSKRSGNTEIWTVNGDGSDLQQVTRLAGPNVSWPVWSPKAASLAYTIFGFNSFIVDLERPWDKQTPQALPPYGEHRGLVSAWSWSPDGRRIAGFEQSASGAYAGIVLYSLDTQKFEKLTDFGVDPVWLSDNRRLLFHHRGAIHLVDSQTKRTREILAIAPQEVARRGFSVGPNDRRIYFSVANVEADIWLANLE